MRNSKADDVLRGARTIFLRCGFEGASVDAIAEEANVSKATLYAHSPSKERLFLIVVDTECARLSAAISRPLPKDLDPRAILEELSRRLINLVLDDDYIRLLRACIGAVSVLPEAGEIYMKAGPKLATRHVGQVVHALHDAKALNVEDHLSAAGQLIHLSVSGVIMPRLLTLDPKIDVSDYAKRAVDAFLKIYSDTGQPRAT